MASKGATASAGGDFPPVDVHNLLGQNSGKAKKSNLTAVDLQKLAPKFATRVHVEHLASQISDLESRVAQLKPVPGSQVAESADGADLAAKVQPVDPPVLKTLTQDLAKLREELKAERTHNAETYVNAERFQSLKAGVEATATAVLSDGVPAADLQAAIVELRQKVDTYQAEFAAFREGYDTDTGGVEYRQGKLLEAVGSDGARRSLDDSIVVPDVSGQIDSLTKKIAELEDAAPGEKAELGKLREEITTLTARLNEGGDIAEALNKFATRADLGKETAAREQLRTNVAARFDRELKTVATQREEALAGLTADLKKLQEDFGRLGTRFAEAGHTHNADGAAINMDDFLRKDALATSGVAMKTDLPDMSEYVKTDALPPTPDLNGYVKTDNLEAAIDARLAQTAPSFGTKLFYGTMGAVAFTVMQNLPQITATLGRFAFNDQPEDGGWL